MCRSNNIYSYRVRAFTLPEVVMALLILGLITSSILYVINSSLEAAADHRLKMEAFRIARDNMEKLLAVESVPELLMQGQSDQNPDMQWRTSVETFYEPQTDKMWVKAVSSVTYFDSNDEQQTVEFEHWLTDLSMEEMMKIAEQKNDLQQKLKMNDEQSEEPDQNDANSLNISSDRQRTVDADNKKRDWLPHDWDKMTNDEQFNWMLHYLLGKQK